MKKLFAIALTALMALMMFAGCGAQKDELVMATNAAFPPYEFKDGDGYAGIDIEIAQLIAEKLNKTLVIEDVEFGSIITGVSTGKYDMGIAGLTVTEERKLSVNFTDSYATGIQVMIVKNDSQFTSIDDFFNYDADGNPISLKVENVKIGVQENTTGDIYCSSEVKSWGFGEQNVVRYKNGADAVAALIKGDVDCVVIDNEPAKSFVAANKGIKILETEYAYEDYAIAIGKDNEQLLADVNKILAELKESGELQKIIDKYIPAN